MGLFFDSLKRLRGSLPSPFSTGRLNVRAYVCLKNEVSKSFGVGEE